MAQSTWLPPGETEKRDLNSEAGPACAEPLGSSLCLALPWRLEALGWQGASPNPSPGDLPSSSQHPRFWRLQIDGPSAEACPPYVTLPPWLSFFPSWPLTHWVA